MTGGTVTATTLTLSGNNTKSAGTMATISDGVITSSDKTAIYWPMAGTLTITGGQITGGTGIEAKLGTINISDDAIIIGTGDYKEDVPMNGGSSPEGSTLLLSAHMYTSYDNNNDLAVNITGGQFPSRNGNAVTLYDTLKKRYFCNYYYCWRRF